MFCYWVRNLISLIDRGFFFYFHELNIFFKSVRLLVIYQSLEIKITIIMNNTLDFKKALVTIEYNCFSYVLMICTYTWFFFLLKSKFFFFANDRFYVVRIIHLLEKQEKTLLYSEKKSNNSQMYFSFKKAWF